MREEFHPHSMTIAVIGAGTMGHGIAQLFATYGYPVQLTDSQTGIRHGVLNRIAKNLHFMAGYGSLDEGDIDTILARITVTENVEAAVTDAVVVIEAVFEEMALKHAILRRIEAVCSPETVIASNSSSFRVGDMAVALERPERFIGTHYFNPPYLMPLVEVIRGEKTEEWVSAATCELLRSVGRYPALIHKDVAGFVGNRMQHALRREAIALVEAGVASPQDVDLIARLTFGLRLPLIGPLEVADLSGLDLTHHIQSYLLPDLNRSQKPSALVEAKIAQGKLGVKSGEGFYQWNEQRAQDVLARRDQGLMEMLRWMQDRDFLPSFSEDQADEESAS